jgi:hypothetical protein
VRVKQPLGVVALALALWLAPGCRSTGVLIGDDDDATTDDDDATTDDDDATTDDDDATTDDDDATTDDDDATTDDDDATTDDDDATADDDDATTDDDDATTDDDDSAGDDDDSAGDDDDSAGVGIFDCLNAPTTSPGEVVVPGARGYHGLAFDESGLIVGSDGNSLIKSDRDGNWFVFLPGSGFMQQMTYLPGGDLAYAAGNGVTRVTPAGGTSIIVSNLSLYGLILGPDNLLWGAGSSGIYTIDHNTGSANFLFNLGGATAHSLGFSPAGDRLYIGTIGPSIVYSVDIDAQFNPVGVPTPFATNVGGGWHDGVGVDACGYLYVPDFWDSKLFRISPSGAVNVFVDWTTSTGYGHGAVFGNGIGGWEVTNLYVPLPYAGNGVKEVEIGVPAAGWGGVVLNAP